MSLPIGGMTMDCCGGGWDKSPMGRGPIRWAQGDNPAFTNVCGNVAYSPVSCDCCPIPEVVPYTPASAELNIQPACEVI